MTDLSAPSSAALDHWTYIARYEDLIDGKDRAIDVSKVDVSMNGIEPQDRTFFAAIRDGGEQNASLRQALPCASAARALWAADFRFTVGKTH